MHRSCSSLGANLSQVTLRRSFTAWSQPIGASGFWAPQILQAPDVYGTRNDTGWVSPDQPEPLERPDLRLRSSNPNWADPGRRAALIKDRAYRRFIVAVPYRLNPLVF